MTSRAEALRFETMAAEYLERMGKRMRERREELGLSRDHVAREMGGRTTGNQIYRWEIGKHQASPDALERLAGVLEVDVAYFMSDGPSRSAAPPTETSSDPFAQMDRIESMLGRVLDLLEGRATSDPAGDAAEALVSGIVADLEVGEAERSAPGSDEQSDAKPAARRADSRGKRRA
jgi:transcriptional regulator with XRE-family HTH domain